MGAVVRPVLALREAARLINVWAAHGHEDTTPRALAHWATQTASLTPSTPRPKAGLDTLLLLGLADSARDGSLRASAPVRACGTVVLAPDRLPAPLRRVLLERLLHLADCAAPLREALGHAMIEAGKLRVPWRSVPVAEQLSPAWLWLQELDLAEHEGDALTLDDSLRPFVLEVDVQRIAISQAELEARIAAQRERAWAVEDLVVTLERTRLAAAGAVELAELVRRISVENALAGYDVESYEVTGAPRLIEVKGCAGPRDRGDPTRIPAVPTAGERGAERPRSHPGSRVRLPDVRALPRRHGRADLRLPEGATVGRPSARTHSPGGGGDRRVVERGEDPDGDAHRSAGQLRVSGLHDSVATESDGPQGVPAHEPETEEGPRSPAESQEHVAWQPAPLGAGCRGPREPDHPRMGELLPRRQLQPRARRRAQRRRAQGQAVRGEEIEAKGFRFVAVE
jgi:hypothetical protein